MSIYTTERETFNSNPGRGVWNTQNVSVYRQERKGAPKEKVAEYIRNYPDFYDTFLAFKQDGRDLALYSPDYMATRLLDLTTGKDIGGEEAASRAFCPVEYKIPKRSVYGERFNSHPDLGLVAGCEWGDESTWKLQTFDLSKASEGILKREEKFGYLELAKGLKLNKAVRVEWSEAGIVCLSVASLKPFQLKTEDFSVIYPKPKK